MLGEPRPRQSRPRDLGATLPPAERYSFVFDGNAQALDHVLVTQSPAASEGLHYGRAGADFPATYLNGPCVRSGSPTTTHRSHSSASPRPTCRSPSRDPPNPALTGSTLVWTIEVGNAGPYAATTVAATDTLPEGMTFRSLTPPAGWACTVPPVGGGAASTCTTASLAARAAETFILELDVDCGLPNGATLTNAASVAAQTDDPAASDNSATATVTASYTRRS